MLRLEKRFDDWNAVNIMLRVTLLRDYMYSSSASMPGLNGVFQCSVLLYTL